MLILAVMAQQAEHVLGKDEVTGSNPVNSSKKKSKSKDLLFFLEMKRALRHKKKEAGLQQSECFIETPTPDCNSVLSMIQLDK